MKVKKRVSYIVFFLSLGITCIQAQESMPATGGNATGSEGSVSYTMGQVVYTTNTGTNGSVTQGVQQPYEIMVIEDTTDIVNSDKIKNISLQSSVYPNPVNENLILKIDNELLSNCVASLFDIYGRLVKETEIISNETHINLGNLEPSTYILKILSGNKEIKIFKIIKN